MNISAIPISGSTKPNTIPVIMSGNPISLTISSLQTQSLGAASSFARCTWRLHGESNSTNKSQIVLNLLSGNWNPQKKPRMLLDMSYMTHLASESLCPTWPILEIALLFEGIDMNRPMLSPMVILESSTNTGIWGEHFVSCKLGHGISWDISTGFFYETKKSHGISWHFPSRHEFGK